MLSCMLGEDSYYEDGKKITDAIIELANEVDGRFVFNLAIEARTKYHLRHVPLLLARVLAKRKLGSLVREILNAVIQRPDEIAEFVAMYWKDGKQPLSKQVKLGLADAFNKFDAYQLGKHNQDRAVKLRDCFISCSC